MKQGIFSQSWLPQGFGANVPEATAVRQVTASADPDAYVCGRGTSSGFPPSACGERFCDSRGMLPGEVAPNIALIDEWCTDGSPVFIYGAGLRGGYHHGGGGGGHRGGGGGGHRGGGGGHGGGGHHGGGGGGGGHHGGHH